MIESDKGVLQFESDRWQARPLLSDGSFLSAGKVIKRDVTFAFKVFSPRQDGNSEIFDVEVSTEQTFIVNYHPGKPSSIAVISPLLDDILELKAGDNVPLIKIACFDEFGNRTAPHQGHCWHLKLDAHGPLQSHLDTPESYDIPVLSSGEATLINFKVRRMGGSERTTETHGVYLETPDFRDYGRDPPRLSINIKMKPSHHPVGVEILYKGKALPSPWIVPVGSTISDLSFRILDEGGEVIVLSDLGRQNKRHSGLVINWAVGKKIRKATTPDLPNITIPNKYSSEPVECSVELRLDDDDFSFQFDIVIKPGTPVAWKILYDTNNSVGIISGNSLDLLSKIQGVCLVDSFGNMVDIDEEGSEDFQVPVLTALYHRPQIEQSHDSTPIALNSEMNDGYDNDSVSASSSSKRNDKRKRGKDKVND